MYAGLAGSVINMIIWAAAGSGVIRRQAAIADPAAAAAANGAADIYAAAAVVIGLISAGLWVGMALANRYGQSWARIASTVLFGVYTIAALGSFARPTVTMPDGRRFDVPAPAAAELITWILWLAGLAAVIAVWQQQSSAYYRAVKRPGLVGLAGPYPPPGSYAAYPPHDGQHASLPPHGPGPGQPAYGSAPPGPPWDSPASAGPAQSAPPPQK